MRYLFVILLLCAGCGAPCTKKCKATGWDSGRVTLSGCWCENRKSLSDILKEE